MKYDPNFCGLLRIFELYLFWLKLDSTISFVLKWWVRRKSSEVRHTAKLDYQVEEKDRDTADSWGSLYNRAKTFLKSPQKSYSKNFINRSLNCVRFRNLISKLRLFKCFLRKIWIILMQKKTDPEKNLGLHIASFRAYFNTTR